MLQLGCVACYQSQMNFEKIPWPLVVRLQVYSSNVATHNEFTMGTNDSLMP